MIIASKQLSRRSLFKLLFVGFGAGSLFLWILISLLSMIVSGSLTWEIESVRDFTRFADTMLFWPVFVILWASFTWLFLIIGLALVNRFTNLTLRVKE